MPRSISVAMIVKDEAEHLADCLSGIASVADEVCIVDTGSRDNSVQIARQFKAKLSVYIWCDDFSAARNESLRLCTGHWIFVLDADERVVPSDLSVLRSLADGPEDFAYRFVTRNYTNATNISDFVACDQTDPHANGFAGWFPSAKIRLFPNGRGIRFEGKVHELVNRSIEQARIPILDCPIVIHHYPLTRSHERIREKQELYLYLGRQKVEADPQDAKAYTELGNQYTEVGDYANAAAAYRDALRYAPSDAGLLKDLAGALHMLHHNEEAKQALNLALQLNPGLVDAWRNLGVVFADEKQWVAALECFEQALKLNPHWRDGQRYLSVALEGCGRMADAAEAAVKAIRANPDSHDCLRLYIHLMLRLERRKEARAELQALIDAGAKSPQLHNAIGELCYYDRAYEEAKEHFRRAGEAGLADAYNNLGVVLSVQQRSGEARAAFEKCLESNPGHRGAHSNLEKILGHPEKS